MITRSKSYTTSDNQSFLNIEDAQRHELEALLTDAGPLSTPAAIANVIVNKSEQVVDILTTKGNSRAKARKVNKKAAKPANDSRNQPQ